MLLSAVTEKIIPLHSGYRKLKGFQVAQLVYDETVPQRQAIFPCIQPANCLKERCARQTDQVHEPMKCNLLPPPRVFILSALAVLFGLLGQPLRAASPTLWTGPMISYSQPSPGAQDVLTSHVSLDRA